MNPSDYPTKYNLLQARQGLKLARQGYDLLDKKRQVLLAELRAAKARLHAVKAETSQAVGQAYEALAQAHLEMGRDAVHALRNQAHFPLAGTTASLDAAFFTWQRAKKWLVQLADAENSIYRLTQNIRKARKRAAALGNITIPTYETRIKYIQSQLEERSRDELARLKSTRPRNIYP
ncbi:MAG: V-type ATP synthase subunit D [Defluviitaleaceae bacterium]|nr:V-type ATP synthase subunit D [Defluviitaleaceae bacterium]MCL2239496.1 V-type ATP synthase subunit D [Defluviitaleaceae bacterium]